LSEEAIEKSLDYLENRLRALQAGDTVPIAKIGEEVVGYALVRWEESEKRTQFEQFYVELGRRSQGIGSSLLHQAIHHAETSHIGESRGMFLTTEETNKGGQNLYERFGFHRSQIAAPDAGELRFELDFEKKNS
jgi:ribosomal protein S18 acetylase RimI-like enzyme